MLWTRGRLTSDGSHRGCLAITGCTLVPTTFFLLAFVFTWALLPLAQASTTIAVLALFGPAAAAWITAAAVGGEELHALRSRVTLWRLPVRWYALALFLPLPISALASGVEGLWGAPGPIRMQPITILGLIVFVMVLGEEIGWRGFALPHLLRRHGPWTASVIVGAVWAFWHLPLFYLRGMPQFGQPFVPFVGYTVALSIILTFLFQNTRGSIVLATVFHGAVNTLGLMNAGATPMLRGWGNAVAYGMAAVVIGAMAWNRRAIRL